MLAFLLIAIPSALVLAGGWAILRARSSLLRFFAGGFILGSVTLGILVGWLLVQIGPGRSGVVAVGETARGREFCVVQTYKDLVEPYQVSLYVRDDAGAWRWHYLEHEDNAWRSAKVDIVGERAVVFRNGERFREVDLARPTFTLPPELAFEDVARGHHERFRPCD